MCAGSSLTRSAAPFSVCEQNNLAKVRGLYNLCVLWMSCSGWNDVFRLSEEFAQINEGLRYWRADEITIPKAKRRGEVERNPQVEFNFLCSLENRGKE